MARTRSRSRAVTRSRGRSLAKVGMMSAIGGLGGELANQMGKHLGRAAVRSITRSKSQSRSKSSNRATRPIQSPSTGFSNSMTRLRYKKMKNGKMVKSMSPQDLHVSSDNGFLQSPFNRQATREEFLADRSELLGIYEASNDTQVSFENTTDLTNGSFERKMWVDSMHKEYMITNQSPSVVKMTIWDLVAREDTNVSPILTWVDGYNKEIGVTTPVDGVDTLNAKPTDVREFNRTWKVIKRRVVEIGTGRCHQHRFIFNYNGWVAVGKLTGAQTYIKGITTATLIMANGVPIDNQNAWQLKTPADVVIAPIVGVDRTKLVWVSNERVTTRIMNVKSKKTTYNVSLPTITTAYVQAENDTGVITSTDDAVWG